MHNKETNKPRPVANNKYGNRSILTQISFHLYEQQVIAKSTDTDWQ